MLINVISKKKKKSSPSFKQLREAVKQNNIEEVFPMKTQVLVKFPTHPAEYTFKLSDTPEHQCISEGERVLVDTALGYAVADVIKVITEGKEQYRPEKRVVCRMASLQYLIEGHEALSNDADKRIEKNRKDKNRRAKAKAQEQVKLATESLKKAQEALDRLG